MHAIDRQALSRIMPVWPHETDAELMAIIAKTLANMRAQGINSNWAYDKARHANLLAFYQRITVASHHEWRSINNRDTNPCEQPWQLP